MRAATLERSPVSPLLIPYVTLLLSVVTFGFSGIFAQLADAPGLAVASWRLIIAALVLTIPFLVQPAARRRIDRGTLRQLVTGGTIYAVSVGIFHLALDYTTAANATFLGNISPVWVGLITLVVLKRALPRLFWPGMLIALTGAALIIFGSGGLQGIRSGDLIVLVNSVVWGIYQIYTGQARGAAIGALTWAWGVVAVAAVWTTAVTLLSGYALTGYSGATAAAMLGSGVFSQSLGFVGFSYALGYIQAARVSVINMLQPVVTAIAGYFLLAQPFTGLRLVGGVVVLIGVYLVTRRN